MGGQDIHRGYTLKFGGDKIEQGAITDDDEKRLLEEFVKKVRELDPDVIIGYNIDGYDMPVLQSRMKKLGVRFSIGRDGGVPPSRVQGRFWRLHGRVISDVWWSVKKIMHPKSETLNYVAKELLGEGKDNINRLKIEEEWSNRRDDVIRYCIKDTYLTVEVFERLRVLDRNMFMSTVTRLPLDDVTNGGTSNYVDSILIRRADRLNIGVPLTANEEKEEKIPGGGYVHTIVPGLYSNVVVLDFKSMYPSMIMKYNICFTTLSPEGTIVAPPSAPVPGQERQGGPHSVHTPRPHGEEGRGQEADEVQHGRGEGILGRHTERDKGTDEHVLWGGDGVAVLQVHER